MKTYLTICRSCAQNRGTALLELAETRPHRAGVAVRGHDCLWSCATPCSVQIGAKGKYGYHLCGIAPTPAHAAALLDFAGRHNRSPDGDVAFEDWPEALKGRFMARIPCLPEGEA